MKKKYLFLIYIVTLSFFILPSVLADIGPKPTMQIEVYYNGEGVNSLNAYAFQDLEKNITTNEIGINGKNAFIYVHSCTKNICTFGGFLPERLSVFVAYNNQSFTSNEIERTSFNSYYKLELFNDGSAKLTEITPILKRDITKSYVIALMLTLLIELIVWLMFIKIKKLNKQIIWFALCANFLSLTLIWFLVTPDRLFLNSFFMYFLLIEVGAIIFETIFIYLFNKKSISFGLCLMINIITNVSSVIMGIFLMNLFSIF